MCLAREEEVTVVGEAANGLEALRKARELLPDIVLMDIEMPIMNGLAVTETLHTELPQIRVLILSMYIYDEYVRRIIKSGGRGYVPKNAPPEDLVRAIAAVHCGETCFSSDVAHLSLNQRLNDSAPTSPRSSLTSREREVLTLIAEGLHNKEIAHQIGAGVRNVETHRERIMRKLGIHSIAGLTKFAVSQGLISVHYDPDSK